MPTYASQTSVTSDKSRAEIERTLARYGASSFMYGWDQTRAVVAFEMHGRRLKFVLPMPERDGREFTHTPAKNQRRSAAAAEAAYEQAVRQRWRALALVIKAKLEAVEAVVPPEKRVANVQITATSEEYKPGAEGKLTVKLSDTDGKP